MANRDELAAYTSSLINISLINSSENAELQDRLRTYQVFLKLYEHHRGLLNEILDLENSGDSPVGATLPYIQGFMSDQQTYLVTNLVQGKTQALRHPQNVWIIGRDPNQASISIHDIRLSRCHAAIQYIAGQGFYLIDLDSRNHSFVNGELVRQTLLKDGDQVRVGSVTFSFFLCQSTQTLAPLSTDVVNRLKGYQAAGTQPSRQPFNQCEAEVEDNIPTLDLYNDTSGFLRSNSLE